MRNSSLLAREFLNRNEEFFASDIGAAYIHLSNSSIHWGVTQLWCRGVEFTVCNTSAMQVANFRAQTFSYFTAFPLLFRPSHFISLFNFFAFAVAPLHVFKHSYYYIQTSLDCEGLLLFAQVRSEEHLIFNKGLLILMVTVRVGEEELRNAFNWTA